MLLGEMLNVNDVELLKCERMYLGMDLRAVVMSDVINNVTLSNETRSILIKSHVEHGTSSHNWNKIKVEAKEVAIAVNCYLIDRHLKELSWSDHESNKEQLDNAPAEEVEIKLKISLEKDFKKYFRNWRQFGRGIK